MSFSADQTLDLVEGVLRGEGILFDMRLDKTIVTLWKPADNAPGFFASMAGRKPQYRYEITVVPEGGAKSKIIVNVRTDYVPEADIEGELRDALSRVDAKVVIFQGDRTVLLGDMVRILDLAKAAGAQQIAIAARRANPGEAGVLRTDN